MASFQSSPSTTEGDDATKIEVLAESMYDAVRDAGEKLWTQRDLEELDIIPENNIIMLQKVIQKLCNAWLFRPLRDGSLGLCWKWRSEEDAKKYVLSPRPVARTCIQPTDRRISAWLTRRPVRGPQIPRARVGRAPARLRVHR